MKYESFRHCSYDDAANTAVSCACAKAPCACSVYDATEDTVLYSVFFVVLMVSSIIRISSLLLVTLVALTIVLIHQKKTCRRGKQSV